MARRLPPGIEVRTGADGTRTYRIRWRQGSGRAGRNLSHSFDRLGDAVDAKARITAAGYVCGCPKHAPEGSPSRSASASEAPVSPARPQDPGTSFGVFAARHAAAMTGVGPGYRKRFKREMEMHFAPFAARPLGEISDIDVREWIVGMETGGHPWLHGAKCDTAVTGGELPCSLGCAAQRSPTTIKRLLVQAGSVMAAANKAGLATGNAFRGHRLGRRDRDQHTEMTILTPDEWAHLEVELPAGVDRSLGTVLVGTGLRWGEATALAVVAVDPMSSPPRLHVARAWQDDGEGGYQLGPPKSLRSRRTVSFSAAVLEALIPHLPADREDDFVFTSRRGKPLRHSNWYHRVWLPAVSRFAGDKYDQDGTLVSLGDGKRPRIHDLRHTHVSWLIAAGVPIAAISRRLGHESITTTIDRYGHMLPQLDVDAVAALDAALPARTD